MSDHTWTERRLERLQRAHEILLLIMKNRQPAGISDLREMCNQAVVTSIELECFTLALDTELTNAG